MIMYRVIDNFLLTEDFLLFSKIADRSKSYRVGRSLQTPFNWFNYIFVSEYADVESEINVRFNTCISSVLEKIQIQIASEVNDLPPLFSFGYMYNTYPYQVNKHFDNIYVDKKFVKQEYVTDSYSAFLYGHDYWNPEWGGFLTFYDEQGQPYSIEPKPNRLVFYSLDEMHSVTQIDKSAQDVVRKTFKSSYFRITKSRRHARSVESQIDHRFDF